MRLDPACGGGSFPAPPTSCVGLPAAQAVASGVCLVATPARGPCSPPFLVGKVSMFSFVNKVNKKSSKENGFDIKIPPMFRHVGLGEGGILRD